MKRTLTIFAIALLFAGSLAIVSERTASADQAAWISRSDAAKALRVLADAGEVIHYCAPCGDAAARREAVESIGLARVEGQTEYWEVQVNGEGVDLAYLYFLHKGKRWKNAAMDASIKVSDVPKYLPEHLLAE